MPWLDLVDNDHFLRTLFPAAPSLDPVDLHEVRLHRDGPALHLRFDLPGFPEVPPKKWADAGYDTLQVTLAAWGVSSLTVDGWQALNVGRLEVLPLDARRRVRFLTDEVALDLVADHLRVDTVSAYLRQ